MLDISRARWRSPLNRVLLEWFRGCERCTKGQGHVCRCSFVRRRWHVTESEYKSLPTQCHTCFSRPPSPPPRIDTGNIAYQFRGRVISFKLGAVPHSACSIENYDATLCVSCLRWATFKGKGDKGDLSIGGIDKLARVDRSTLNERHGCS